MEREISSTLSPGHLNPPEQSATTNLSTPGPFLGHLHAPRSDVHSSDRSLQVPDDRRRSIISDVSSASPSPGPESGKQMRRSVSPADDVPDSQKPADVEKTNKPVESGRSADNQLPGYDQVVPEPVDLAPEKSMPDGPPPGIDDHYERREANPNLTTSQPPTVQHTDLTPSANQHGSSNDGPPSSLTGGDGVEQNRQLQGVDSEDFGKASEPPLSPVSQALSKEMSQVSVDEVYDQANAVGQRQSRSYSRPFSADPNVRNHPAFKTSEPEQPSVDRAQMYSSESPLPSARRNPEEVDRLRQQKGTEQYLSTQSTQEEHPSEGTYRIPGPYIQNYRSPKQITTPRVGRSETQVEASGQPLPSALRSQQQQLERQYQQYQSQQQYQQQLQQEQLYQHYQQQPQPQPQPQGPTHTSSESQIMQEPGRPPFIPQQNRVQPDHQQYGGYVPTNTNQYSYEGDHPSNRLSQQPDHFVQKQQQSMGPPPAPTPQTTPANPPAVRKKSTFGSLFGGGSKSKLKKQERPPATIPESQDGPQKDKRASIFRRNSRPDSISSQQSGQYGGQDQVGQLPTWNTATHSGRRQSKDILRTSSHEAKEHPVEKEKKKRFSGLGSKLFKSGSTTKSPAVVSSASPQAQMGTEQRYQQQYSAQNYVSPQNTYGQYSGDAWTTQEQQSPAQFQRGYSHSSQQQQQEARPEYPRGPQQQFSQPQRSFTQPVQQRRPDSQYDYSTPPVSQPESHYPTTTSPFQYSSGVAGGTHPSMQTNRPGFTPPPGSYPTNTVPYLNPDQRRPSDLRIDTNTPNRSSQNIPATAPAQIYPNRESQFSPPPPGNVGARPYGSASPGFTTTTAPTSAAASSTNPGAVRNHVIDLHKRSRSPKLGRKNSSEDFDARRRQEQENGLAATGLGTFISKRISPVGGVPRPESDQERPYAIDLPGLDEDTDQSQAAGHRRTRTMSPIPPSIQENTLGDPTAAARSGTPVSFDGSAKDSGAGATSGGTGTYSRAVHSGATDGLVSRSGTSAAQPTGKAIARDKSLGGAAVELPGSKPDGYESEEEVLMSATAYPGQEWMPTFIGDGRWDD